MGQIAEFLIYQIDFLQFLLGTSFFFIALISYVLYDEQGKCEGTPWLWFSLFSATVAFCRIMGVFLSPLFAYGQIPFPKLVFLVVSNIFLFRFVYSCAAADKRSPYFKLVLVVVTGILLLALFGHINYSYVFAYVFMFFPLSLFAGRSFVVQSQRSGSRSESAYFKIAGYLIVILGVFLPFPVGMDIAGVVLLSAGVIVSGVFCFCLWRVLDLQKKAPLFGSAISDRNAVIVRASASNLARVEKVISEIDRAPLQVHVEAKILELKSGQGETANPSSMGFSWQYTSPTNRNNMAQFFATAAPTQGAVAAGLYAQLLGADVSAFLQALETSIGYDFVAAPWITAVNHHESEILIGGRIGYRNLLATTTGTLQEVQYLSVGTKLRFTPHISKDGFIKMSINPSLSDGVLVDGVPQESITETKNTVVVKDGQTIVIGGLTKDYKNEKTVGVPFLSGIPFFGTLFRRKELISEKRELMVLITPHIVTPEYLKTMNNRAAQLEGRQDKEKVTPLELLK